MKFYRIEFDEAPAEEGEEFIYKQFKSCLKCGNKYIEYSNMFLAPEDVVQFLHAELWGKNNNPLFQVASLLVAEESFCLNMVSDKLTGFSFGEAKVTYRENNIEAVNKKYRWVRITGRCETNNVYEEIGSVQDRGRS